MKIEKISAKPTKISAGDIQTYMKQYELVHNFRDYTEKEFYTCFEQKFTEKFKKLRECRLPWDRKENSPQCETILESV